MRPPPERNIWAPIKQVRKPWWLKAMDAVIIAVNVGLGVQDVLNQEWFWAAWSFGIAALYYWFSIRHLGKRRAASNAELAEYEERRLDNKSRALNTYYSAALAVGEDEAYKVACESYSDLELAELGITPPAETEIDHG